MAKLSYVTNVSLDGYIEDEGGVFAWLPMDDELFAFYTDLLRPVGTFLYGRRLYESMAVWETDPALAARSDLMADFASVWQAASKVVYSATLPEVSAADTRLERRFDPASVRELKATASSDLTVGGANLATEAFQAGLVDECQLFVWPVVVGGGKPGLPTGMRIDLELLDERRFRTASCTSVTALSDNDRQPGPMPPSPHLLRGSGPATTAASDSSRSGRGPGPEAAARRRLRSIGLPAGR